MEHLYCVREKFGTFRRRAGAAFVPRRDSERAGGLRPPANTTPPPPPPSHAAIVVPRSLFLVSRAYGPIAPAHDILCTTN